MNLKELSSLLNLSQTTVSRALGGYPEVSARTRERVIEAATRNNYRPNKRAQGLAIGKSFTIGHVMSTPNREELANPIFGDFVSGITEISAAAGFSLLLTLTEPEAEAATYRKLKSEGSVDGVFLQSPTISDTRIGLMHEVGIPFVVHGRASGVSRPYSWVDVNNLRAFERATTFLLELGHRRIALVNGDEKMDFATRRRNGYLAGLSGAGISLTPEFISDGLMTEETGFRSARTMLSLPKRPTAFVVSSIISAVGVRRAIQEAGLEMGREVSLIAYDDDLSYFRNRSEVPVFTAMRSSVRQAGQEIARMLIAQINSPDASPESFLMETELIVGASTAPAPV